MKSNQIPFYVVIIALFLIIISPKLFSDGMFMDGLLYATISNNMANGIGTFWSPHLTNTLFPVFHEHPPLALGIQSIFFMLFGDSIYVERVYSLLTFIIVGIAIVEIWKELVGSRSNAWIPLIFWIVMPDVAWACSNNMLENTMSVFVILSVLFYLKSLREYRMPYLILSGLMVVLAFLSKGFVGIYTLSIPFWFWLFSKEQKLFRSVADTLIILFTTIISFVLLLAISNQASDSLLNYLNNQVIGSLKNVVTVNSRFYIIGKYFTEIMVGVFIAIVFLIIGWRKKIPLTLLKNNVRIAMPLFLLSLSGVIPIIISLKQRSFYITTVYPFFAIALGVLMLPFIKQLIELIDFESRNFRRFSYFAYLLIITAVVLSLSKINTIGREKERISDVYEIIKIVPANSTVSICEDMYVDWSLHGYFGRYANISLDIKNYNKYYITNGCSNDTLMKNYQEVKLDTKVFKLFKKVDL